MTEIMVEGRRVKVGDEFWSLPRDKQEATVDEIAKSLGVGPKKQPTAYDGGGVPESASEGMAGRATRQQREFIEPVNPLTAAFRGAAQGASANFGDEAAALAAASGTTARAAEANARATGLPYLPNPIDMGAGAIRLGLEKIAPRLFGQAGGEAYDASRAQSRADLSNAQMQQPVATIAGQIAGGLAIPMPAAAASSAPKAIGTGAALGALYGVGEGEGGADRMERGATGAAVGGALGGVLQRLMRPAEQAAPTARQQIVEAAERIETPIARGLASDKTSVRALTQTLRGQAGGSRVEDAVDATYQGLDAALRSVAARVGRRTEEAAPPNTMSVGERIQDEIGAAIAQVGATAQRDATRIQGLRGDAPSLQQAGSAVRGRLESNVAENTEIARAPYDSIRAMLPLRGSQVDGAPEAVQGIQQGLSRVIRARQQAGEQELPSALRPALELATRPEGVTFNGLQRARQSLGDMIDFEKGRGFDTGDLKQVYGQISGAMRDVLARQGGDRAVRAFEAAELQFAGIQTRNAELNAVLRGKDEGFVTGLLSAAMDKTAANAAKFNTLWRELGDGERATVANAIYGRLGKANDGAGEFSIDQFAKNWGAISPQGKAMMFGRQSAEIDLLLTTAQQSAGRSAEYAKDIIKLTQDAPEKVVGRLLDAATNGSGEDFGRLARAIAIMGPKSSQELSDAFVQQLGVNNGAFAPRRFVTEWGKVPDHVKRLLIPDGTHRAALNDIALVSERIAKTYEKFASKSQSNRGVMMGIGSVGGLVEPMTLLATVVAPAVMSRILAQPATTASAAKWARAYEAAVRQPSVATVTAFDRATKNMAATIGEGAGVPDLAEAIMKQIAGGPRLSPADEGSRQEP